MKGMRKVKKNTREMKRGVGEEKMRRRGLMGEKAREKGGKGSREECGKGKARNWNEGLE